jgi:hypothetical protein
MASSVCLRKTLAGYAQRTLGLMVLTFVLAAACGHSDDQPNRELDTRYHANGKKAAEGYTVNNFREGEWNEWNDKG